MYEDEEENGAVKPADVPPASAPYDEESDNSAGYDDPHEEGPTVGNDGAEDAQDDDGDDDGVSPFIPRARFNQVNSEAQLARKYRKFLEQFEEMGGPDALEAAAQQQLETQTKAQRAAREKEIEDAAKALVDEGRVDDEETARDVVLGRQQRQAQIEREQRETAEREREQQLATFDTQFETWFPSVQASYPHASKRAVRKAMLAGDHPETALKEAEADGRELVQRQSPRRDDPATFGAPVPARGGNGPGPTRPDQVPDPIKQPTEYKAYMTRVRARLAAGD